MAKDYIKNVKISAICSAVPKESLKAAEFLKYFSQKEIQGFQKQTGISEKRYSKDYKTITSDMCVAAAEKILNETDIKRDSIDVLVLVTQTPDLNFPATACIIQHRLGLSEDCIVYDINLGCSGYIYGLHAVSSYLTRGYSKRALLLTGETQEGQGADNNLNSLLFGNAGTATVVDYEDGAYGFKFDLKTAGSGFKAICSTSGLRYKHKGQVDHVPNGKLDGLEVFKFATTKVPKSINDFFEFFQIEKEKIDYCFLHQANLAIMKTIMKKIKIPLEKMPLSLEKFGNTSSASIPLTICDFFEKNKNITNNQRCVLSGFGIGLSWGVAEIFLDPKSVLPVIETDLTYYGCLTQEEVDRK